MGYPIQHGGENHDANAALEGQPEVEVLEILSLSAAMEQELYLVRRGAYPVGRTTLVKCDLLLGNCTWYLRLLFVTPSDP